MSGFEQVRALVEKLHAKKPPSMTLTVDLVYGIVTKKVDEAVLRELGGEPAVKVRIGALLKSLSGAAASSSSSSSSDDDDDSSSSDGSSSDGSSSSGSASSNDSKPKQKAAASASAKAAPGANANASADAAGSGEEDDDDDSTSSEDEEDEETDEDEDDIFADSDDEGSEAGGVEAQAGQRRQRDEDDGKDPLEDISNKTAKERCDLLFGFAKKVGMGSRARKGDETDDSYLEYLIAFFKSKEADPNDVSKSALRYEKQKQEVRDLTGEVDLTLDRSQRRGRPIYDSAGNFVGVSGGSAAASKSSLCDD